MLEVVSLQLAAVALRNMECSVICGDLRMAFIVIEVGGLLMGIKVLGFRCLTAGCMVLCHLKSINDRYLSERVTVVVNTTVY